MISVKYSFFALLLLAAAVAGRAQVVVHEINSPSENAVGLCWDGSALWVSDYTTAIRRVDPVTGEVLQTITGPVAGSDGLAWEDGHLWTISRVSSDQTIYKVNAQTGAVVAQIADPAAGNAGGAVWENDGLWVSQYFPQDRFLKVNPVTQQVVANIPAPGNQPYGMAWDGAALWNSSEDGTNLDRIYRIDPVTGAALWSFVLPPHTPTPGRRPRGLAWDGQHLWVLAYAVNGYQVKIFKYDVSNALNPDIDVATTTYHFGGHVVGFPVEWSTRVRNIGNMPLVLDSARFAVGQGYNVLAPGVFPTSVPARDSVLLTVRFDPPVPGQYPDTLRLYSNDPDENVVAIRLGGNAYADEGDIDFVPMALDFGDVRVNAPILSSSRSLEIWNLGAGVLTVTGAQILAAEFTMDPVPWPVQIDSSSFFRVRVWFAPQAYGLYESFITFTSDDPDEPAVEVFVTGVGIDEPVPGGEAMWVYAATGGFDRSINAVHWINDVNNDGIADVVAASENYRIYCLNGSSTGIADTFWTYSTGLDNNHTGDVEYERGLHRIDDLDGDGIGDVILGTGGGSRSVYALSGRTGAELWMFDTRFWGAGGWVYEVHPMADVTGDGVPDVVAAAGTSAHPMFALNGANGQLLWSGPGTQTFYCVRTFEDVTGDGLPDVVGGGSSGRVQARNAVTGDTLWNASVGTNSPVFALLPMGNANPDVNFSEDIAVASAYQGVYVLDGLDGSTIWFTPFGFNVYEIAIGSDTNDDGVREVYIGGSNLNNNGGWVICLDGRTGSMIWNQIADPNTSQNVLTMTAVPDVTGDELMDIVVGTRGRYVILMNGYTGTREWFHMPSPSEVDATGILPDIDGNNSWEILVGSRDGTITCYSGGLLVSSANSNPVALPSAFRLDPPFPNPFNAVVTVPYSIPSGAQVTLQVYDLLGRHVETLFSGHRHPGAYHAVWNAHAHASGTYIVVLDAPQARHSSRITLLK